VARPNEEIRTWSAFRPGGRNTSGIPGEYGGLSHVEEVVSNLYAYPIAAFARIIAENPSLQAKYGDDA